MTARNGKGSTRRGVSREERERYAEGWDRIFRKPKRPKRRPTSAP